MHELDNHHHHQKKKIRRKRFKSPNFHFSQTDRLTAFHKEIDRVCVTLSVSPQIWWMFTLRAREHFLLHRMRKAGSSSCSLPLDRQGHGPLASHHSISLFPILNSCKIKQWRITLWVLGGLTDSCDNRCGIFCCCFLFCAVHASRFMKDTPRKILKPVLKM